MNNKNVPVLMTASVSTHGMKSALFSDEEREQMYLSTLAYYLENMPGVKFVFAEYSGWNWKISNRNYPLPMQNIDNVEYINIA